MTLFWPAILFWLAILGLLTYIILRRSIPLLSVGRLGALWLVMMAPAMIWTLWELLHPVKEQPIPLPLILGPFFLCLLLYLFLLARWRPSPQKSDASSSAMQHRSEEHSNSTMPKPDFSSPKPPLNAEEEADLRRCFSLSTYFLHKIEYRLQAVICQGQLRIAPAQAYAVVEEKVRGVFGDRFLLLLQEDLSGKPFFALVPNPHRQQTTTHQPATRRKTTRYRYGLALVLLLLTLVTTTLVGMGMAGFPVDSFEAIAQQPDLLRQGLPYALPLLLILGIHEGGHFGVARRYKLNTSLPYFIPAPSFLGTFGAFIQIRSPMPDRKTLFDVGIAGPLAGLVATLPLLAWGLAHSEVVPLDPNNGLLNFSALNPRYSIFVMLLGRLVLGNELTVNGALALHPVAIAGYLGLVVTALNLMPIGQLDGGHLVHAMFGQKVGAMIGQVARLLVLLLSLVQKELLIWAIMLFLIPTVDEPALNDVSELDNGRDGLGLAALAVLFLIILPVPPVLANLIF